MSKNIMTLLFKLALILVAIPIVSEAEGIETEKTPELIKFCQDSKLTESLLSRSIQPKKLQQQLQKLKQASAKLENTDISNVAGEIAYKLIFPPIHKPTQEYMEDVSNTLSFIMCQFVSQ